MQKVINKIKEKLPDVCIYLLLFFVVLLIYCFSKNNGLLYDDFVECSYRLNEGIFDSLLPSETVHGGGYTSIFFTKFMTLGIPYLFNLHPQDYLFEIAPIIKGILYALFFFVSIKCVLLRNHSKCFFITSLMFMIFYLLYFLHAANLMCIKDNETFFRYVFCTMFYYIFFSYIYKNIIFRNVKFKVWEFSLIIFSVISVASNLETIIFAFYLFFFLIMGYNLLVDFIFYFRKLNVFKRIYKYNLNLKFYVPVIFFYIISFIYICSPRYYNNFKGRGFGSFKFSIREVCDFFNLFFHFYILDNILYWIVLIVLIIVYFYKQKSVFKKKKLFCSLFMIISIIAVYFSLIVCGKNSYDGNYWINDIKLWIFFKILVLAPAFILLDDIIRHISVKYKKGCIRNVCCCLFIISIYYAGLMYNNRFQISDVYIFQKVNYINEKMYRYFSLKNETPYLIKINPNPRDNGWMPFLFLEILEGNHEYMQQEEICSSEETRTSVYLQKVYNDNYSEEMNYVKFCFRDDAIDKFFNAGGAISKKELNDIKFSKLKDSNYVLNNEIPFDDKMSKDEIISIFRSFYH